MDAGHHPWSNEALIEGFCLEVSTPPSKSIFMRSSVKAVEGGCFGHTLAGPALAHSVVRVWFRDLCLVP